ncbi:MAG: thiamine ABC transporter substrate-binding protein [Acidimicrobiia bacterium]|nr:thiamine ABC transporter substrate-binding protein [Acidimicrobiia bacterium]
MSRRTLVVLLTAAAALALGACGSSNSSGGSATKTVTLVTHDSFAISKPVMRAFTRQTGWKVRILKNGDAGVALNQVILTKNAPLGDVMFGVDNTFLTRALSENVFARYRAAGIEAIPRALRLDPTNHATPIDFGDVCVNADRKYFSEHHLEIPKTLDDLTQSQYRDLLVVENPATSSPGLAFVAATVARFGTAWPQYWDRLRANGVKAVDGWEQAYNGEFSGAGGGKGDRPLVVSYASSPPAEVYFADPPPTTAPTVSLDDTCFRQVEFAGVLRGAAHPDGARALVDFMLTRRFQSDMPLQMFVNPAVPGTPLPAVFTKFATIPADPFTLSPARIGHDRAGWIDEWTARVLR